MEASIDATHSGIASKTTVRIGLQADPLQPVRAERVEARPPFDRLRANGLQTSVSGNSTFIDIDRRIRHDAVEEFDDVGVAHADAAVRSGFSHCHRVRTAVDVDVAAHGVAVSQPVETRLATGEPENARKNPVTFGKEAAKFGPVDFAAWTTRDEDGAGRLSGAD